MTTQLLKQALDALENSCDFVFKDVEKAALRDKAIQAIRTHLASPPEVCQWTSVNDEHMPDTYESACGDMWSFIEGGINENNIRFCQGCGKKVIEASAPKEQQP